MRRCSRTISEPGWFGVVSMRSAHAFCLLTSGLLITLCAAADAAPAHHRRTRPHTIVRPSPDPVVPVSLGAGTAFPAIRRYLPKRTEISTRLPAAAAEMESTIRWSRYDAFCFGLRRVDRPMCFCQRSTAASSAHAPARYHSSQSDHSSQPRPGHSPLRGPRVV